MDNVKLMIDPTEYKAFLERYIKELHEVDAPMIAGAVERCLRKLEEQPTVEAVEVVHGRWIGQLCSVCNESYMDYADADSYPAIGEPKPNYCPNCGAKMDGGEQ